MKSTSPLYIVRNGRKMRFRLGDLSGGSLNVTLAARLWELIQRSEFQTGDLLPTEMEFAEHLGTSRDPISRALRTLQEDGRVQGRPGWGWFVA